MAEIIMLPTFEDERGALTVLEKALPYSIKRVYWMHKLSGLSRGGHRHIEARQAFVCLQGSCEMLVRLRDQESKFSLGNPNQCLLLEPEDWHLIDKIEPNSLMLVLASHAYDPNDYRTDPL